MSEYTIYENNGYRGQHYHDTYKIATFYNEIDWKRYWNILVESCEQNYERDTILSLGYFTGYHRFHCPCCDLELAIYTIKT